MVNVNTPFELQKWNPVNGMSPLSVFIQQIVPQLSKELTDYITYHSFHSNIKRGKHLVRYGDQSPYLFLLMKGSMRAYIRQNNKEVTTWLNLENNILTAYKSFLLQEPSIENIQALEDCELVCISYKDIQSFYQQSFEANTVGRKLLEQLYIEAEERSFMSKISSAEDRYSYFVEKHGDYINRIALRHIASHLSMTEETLSRIRAKRRGVLKIKDQHV